VKVRIARANRLYYPGILIRCNPVAADADDYCETAPSDLPDDDPKICRYGSSAGTDLWPPAGASEEETQPQPVAVRAYKDWALQCSENG